MADLVALAAAFNEVRDDPAAVPEARKRLRAFIDAYRGSDALALQVLDASDASTIERGDRGVRPPMWSTKNWKRGQQSGPWVASNGRWSVEKVAEDECRLFRYFGGRWREIDQVWRHVEEPLVTLEVSNELRTNWDALWLALRIDYWEGIAVEAFEAAEPWILDWVKREPPEGVRYTFEDAGRYVTVVDDDGDAETYYIGFNGREAPGTRRLEPTTGMHEAVRDAAVGQTVTVQGSGMVYNVRVTRIAATPPN